MSWKTTALICTVLLLVAVGITTAVFLTEPTAQRETATKETAMLVDVVEVQRGTFRPELVAMGTVEPSQEITLSPRVSGEIVGRDPAFTPGGRVREGQVLLRIDPADYEIALARRRSELRRATADLEIEMGRQNVAEKDLQLFQGDLPADSRALVLREPQLDTARAAVESARAAVDQAELDLARTRVRAPFDALILRRDVNVGSQVSPGEPLGHLVGIEAYWVTTTVPLSQLRWITFPDVDGAEGSEVRVRDDAAWPEGAHRVGRVESLVGALEGQTRLARVLVTVPDPLADDPDDPLSPPLMIGSFVRTRILAREVEDVVKLDRDHVRQNDTAWVMEEGELRIRELEVVVRDRSHAYVRSGLEHGDRVVVTNLSTVTDGAPLRLEGER